MTIGDQVDKAGQAADIGSACHAAVSTWHSNGKDVAAAVEAMRLRVAEYPLADLPQAAALFLAYTSDPLNNVDLALNEEEVVIELPCTHQDPTGTPIVIIGHADQVRRENGVLRLWDLKTSKKDPFEVLWSTEIQAAAYCKGATEKLGEQVHPGGIIMPRRKPMHIPFQWTAADINRILDPVRHMVALVRSGVVYHNPEGERCKWCHTGGPEACLPTLRHALPVV